MSSISFIFVLQKIRKKIDTNIQPRSCCKEIGHKYENFLYPRKSSLFFAGSLFLRMILENKKISAIILSYLCIIWWLMQSSMKSVTSSFIIVEANKITYLTIKFDLTSLVGCFCIRIQNQMRNFDSKQCQQNSFYSSSNKYHFYFNLNFTSFI